MPTIRYRDAAYDCRAGESVIEALLRHGLDVPFSCRNGICQVCLQRCASGTVPEAAQVGLRPTLRAQGYFLPCKCVPQGDMEIEPPREADLYSPAVVYRKEQLAPDVFRLLLEPATALRYRAGQFINLRRADGLTRSYSLASLPDEDYFLELHVKRMPGGAMSNWICDELNVDDELEIQGPQGNCCYVAGSEEQNLLLVGTGTGLAPLIGICRDALQSGHRGQIFLYHGSRQASGLYLSEALRDLQESHANFHYVGCVGDGGLTEGLVPGYAHEVAFAEQRQLAEWQVYLAGSPQMVQEAEKLALQAGAQLANVHADPFEFKEQRSKQRERSSEYPPPDPEMWAALKNGALLTEILTDFYTRVYDDPRLVPYFHATTKQRSIEKQFLFLRQIFTGEKVYFGDRPRNAHHWMVISDELFDYREELMETCLRSHGLSEHLIRRWRAMEERTRADIVKTSAWPKVVDGVELPLDGFEETTLSVGSMCDGCNREVQAGEKVRYHVRLGTIYCRTCTLPEST